MRDCVLLTGTNAGVGVPSSTTSTAGCPAADVTSSLVFTMKAMVAYQFCQFNVVPPSGSFTANVTVYNAGTTTAAATTAYSLWNQVGSAQINAGWTSWTGASTKYSAA